MSSGGGPLALGDGMVDLPGRRLVGTDRFVVAGASAVDQDTGADGLPQSTSVISGGTVYVLAALGGSTGGEWLACETGSGGLESSVLAPLLWLRGHTSGPGACTAGAGHDVVVDLATYLERTDPQERHGARQALESARVGLSAAVLPATVWLDAEHCVERLTLRFPAGASAVLPVSHDEQEIELQLRYLDSTPVIPVPDARLHVSADELLRATAESSGVPTWDGGTP